MTAMPRLLLASASPRRREMLERVGIALDVVPADIDETPHAPESPAEYVARVALAKARAVAAQASQACVLAADTTVTIDGAILGKPDDEAHARAMLQQLSGRTHQVLTAFAIVAPGHALPMQHTVASDVEMVVLSAAMIDDYVACGEWRGKAGGYAVQGIGAAMVAQVRGSVTNVIGLPLAEVVAALASCGVPAQFVKGQPQ
ncbi:MAG TPA: nucleoside triphosphate pyrophosphatase [Kofleriaceae bacterium]|nr:nucleoside triphosphate pyrophosphatase [Kofleriaceae bacterium]